MKIQTSYMVLFMLAAVSESSFAQQKEWTLDECIEYALGHNIDIRRKGLSVEGRRIGLSEAKWSYAPSFSAGSSYGMSSGRILDETTYSFIENETAGSSSASVSGSMELFARPEVVAAALGVELAKRDLKIAQSYCSPGISLSAGYGSSHSDARRKMLQNPDGTFRYEAYPFFRQYADNASSYVSVSLNIPIFAGLSVRKDVQRKRLAIRDSEYALTSVRKSVMKELHKLRTDAGTVWEKYIGATEQARYTEEAVRMLTVKYEAGAADVLSYVTAMTELAKARHSMNASKYEYIFNVKILQLYLLF